MLFIVLASPMVGALGLIIAILWFGSKAGRRFKNLIVVSVCQTAL